MTDNERITFQIEYLKYEISAFTHIIHIRLWDDFSSWDHMELSYQYLFDQMQVVLWGGKKKIVPGG